MKLKIIFMVFGLMIQHSIRAEEIVSFPYSFTRSFFPFAVTINWDDDSFYECRTYFVIFHTPQGLVDGLNLSGGSPTLVKKVKSYRSWLAKKGERFPDIMFDSSLGCWVVVHNEQEAFNKRLKN